MHFEDRVSTCNVTTEDSIPSPQAILTMHDMLTMVMLPAGVKNSQDYNSRDILTWVKNLLKSSQNAEFIELPAWCKIDAALPYMFVSYWIYKSWIGVILNQLKLKRKWMN